MPVELPVSDLQEAAPEPPRAIVWLVLFVVCLVAGMVDTVLTWPKTEPTGSTWFWTRGLILPTVAWGIAFIFRSFYYDDERNRLLAEDDALQKDRAVALQFASEPLAVLGCAYLSGLGSSGVASQIAHEKKALNAQQSSSSDETIRHTALALFDDQTALGRYRSCFLELLDRIANDVAAVPRNVPLSVRLHFAEQADGDALLGMWQACWREYELRPAKAVRLRPEQGLMALDEWLDIRGGPSLEKFILFVSVQLHDTSPKKNSAEAAVALMLGWAALAGRRGIKPLALLNRPVEAESTLLNDAIPTALLWGETSASDISDLWQAGLEKLDKPALIQSTSDLALGISRTEDLSGIHDIDKALGNPGVAAGWLATALAIEHVTQSGKPQLIAWRERSLRLAVAQPATKEIEMKIKI